ncbi:MAG: type II secretion protein F [Methanosarcinales archaeon]|nr:MAG: type II secretion protein F [Methanosarcinales archaeon]
MGFVSIAAYRIFGNGVRKRAETHHDLEVQLHQAHIPVPIDQYLSSAYFYSLIAGFVGAIAGYYAGLRLFADLSLPATIGIDGSTWVDAHQAELLSAAAGLLLFTLVFYIVYLIYAKIPATKANIRKSQIDQSLPHAVAYLYALNHGGGMNLFDIFKSLSGYAHIYGAAAEEFGRIIRDVEYFGYDMLTALQNANNRTSSDKFKDFVDGLISIVSSGGDVTTYLMSKTRQYHSTAAREQKAFLEALGIMAEVYIAVFVVGPLFMMTVLVVIGLIDAGSSTILYVLIYALIPAGTAIYLVILDMISDVGKKSFGAYAVEKKPDVFSDVRVKPLCEDQAKLIHRMQICRRLLGFRALLLHPFRLMRYKPAYSFLMSIPLAILYMYSVLRSSYPDLSHISIGTVLNVDTVSALDDRVFFAVLIVCIPFIIFRELRNQRIRQIEDQIPEFMRKLASINDAGILLVDAITMVAQAKIGVLQHDVKQIVGDITWGTIMTDALRNFEYRVKTDMASRITTLIVRASESTSDVKSVLVIAAGDAEVQKQTKNERTAEMFVYVFIIYVAFFVFLFTIYVLAAYFLTAMTGSLSEAASDLTMINKFDMEMYTALFFHAALIQGFCSGLVAGKMSTGSISSGLKHSVAMMLISYGVFTLFI